MTIMPNTQASVPRLIIWNLSRTPQRHSHAYREDSCQRDPKNAIGSGRCTMAKKLKSSLYVVLAGVVLLLSHSVPASAQVLSHDGAGNAEEIPLKKHILRTAISLTASAPQSGCPCLVFVSYFVPIKAGSTTSLIESEAVVSDDTTGVTSPVFGLSEQTVPSDSSRSLQRTDLDPASVANGDIVTLNVNVMPAQEGMAVEPHSQLLGSITQVSVFFMAAAF